MDFAKSLDRYLTTPPDDGFECWCESVIRAVSPSCYERHQDFFDATDGTLDKWLNKLFDRNHFAKDAAKIIERAVSLFLSEANNGIRAARTDDYKVGAVFIVNGYEFVIRKKYDNGIWDAFGLSGQGWIAIFESDVLHHKIKTR